MTGLRSPVPLLGMVLIAPLASAQSLKLATPPQTPPASANVAANDSVTWVEVTSKNGDLRGKLPQLVAAEVGKAKAMGLTPFIEVGATWCGPCQALEASLHNKDIIDAFAGSYIIHLDVNEWDVEDEMGPLGIKGSSIPFMVALNTKDHAIAQTNDLDTPGIKKFVTGHLWPASTSAPKHVVSVAKN